MGGRTEEELGIWLHQLHSLKRDREDNDSFCGVFLKRYELWDVSWICFLCNWFVCDIIRIVFIHSSNGDRNWEQKEIRPRNSSAYQAGIVTYLWVNGQIISLKQKSEVRPLSPERRGSSFYLDWYMPRLSWKISKHNGYHKLACCYLLPVWFGAGKSTSLCLSFII